MIPLRALVLLTVLSALAFQSAASQVQDLTHDSEEESPFNTVHLTGSLGFSTTGFDPVATDDLGLGERGYGFLLDFGVQLARMFEVQLSTNLEWLSDSESFTQSTTGGTKESEVCSYGLTVGVGLFTPTLKSGPDAGPSVAVGVLAGRDFRRASRGIGTCTNCRSDELELGGGPYVGGALRLLVFSRSGFEVRYLKYSDSGDPRSGLGISLFVFGLGGV